MKYTESHEWVKVEGDIGTVGISQYAQKELGDIVYVELPKVEYAVKAGEVTAVLESTKAAVDVYSPVSGTIVAVNSSLKEASELINQSPEDKGWLFKVALTNSDELNSLMDESTYQTMVGQARK